MSTVVPLLRRPPQSFLQIGHSKSKGGLSSRINWTRTITKQHQLLVPDVMTWHNISDYERLQVRKWSQIREKVRNLISNFLNLLCMYVFKTSQLEGASVHNHYCEIKTAAL